mgnify:CR=1 FL=1
MADKEVLRESSRWEEFNSIIDNEDLDIKEKGLLLILFRFVNYKTGYADPSRILIKKLTNITDNRTLDKLMNNLIDKGFLKRESKKGKRSKYFIKVGGKITPSVKNVPSVKNTPIVGGKITPQKENKRKIKENIYSSSEDEDSISYFERINKEIDSLEKEINNNYDKDLIQKEKEKLISKKLCGLPLLKELKKELENHNKKIKKEQSNKDVEDIWKLYPLKRGKTNAIKKIPNLLKKYGKNQIERCIERYIEDVEYQRSNGFTTLNYKNGATFFNGGYVDYLDCNYEEIKAKSIHKPIEKQVEEDNFDY